MKTAKGMMVVLAGAVLALLVSVAPASAGDTARKKEPQAQASDTQLEQKVAAQLQADVRLARQPVHAGVKKGVVTLTGTVDTEADKTRAAQIARTNGATKVDNRLAVVETSEAGSDPSRKSPPQEQQDPAETKPADKTGSTTDSATTPESLKEKSKADREKSELPPLQSQPQKPPLRDPSGQPF